MIRRDHSSCCANVMTQEPIDTSEYNIAAVTEGYDLVPLLAIASSKIYWYLLLLSMMAVTLLVVNPTTMSIIVDVAVAGLAKSALMLLPATAKLCLCVRPSTLHVPDTTL